MPLMIHNGRFLIAPSGKFAMSAACCCGDCCNCIPTRDILASVSGAVSGTGTLLRIPTLTDCWKYSGGVELTAGPCVDGGGSLCLTPQLTLRCPQNATNLSGIELLIENDPFCGLCSLSGTLSPTYKKPRSISCNQPCGLIGTWDYTMSGWCSFCGADLSVEVVLSESVLPCV